jgi:hypothetical protein
MVKAIFLQIRGVYGSQHTGQRNPLLNRLTAVTARLRRKAGYPLHKTLDSSADRLGNVKGNKQAHGFYSF